MSFPSLKMSYSLRLGASVALALATALSRQAYAQTTPPPAAITAAQIKTLLPDENDLQGFVRIRPAFDTPERIKSQPIPDDITVNAQQQGVSGKTSTVSGIGRVLYSQDEVYTIGMSLTIMILQRPRITN